MLHEDNSITNDGDAAKVLAQDNVNTNIDSLEKTVEKNVNEKISKVEKESVGETYAFSADISQLMSLIINTFYSNKDIFLRELISNSSDALDKIRYESLTNSDALKSNENLKIQIIPNIEENTLTIRDTGIGMTKKELINNLGTIAKSGTKAFMEALSESSDMSMIGQFGVGFYSAYLVASQVCVITKNNADEVYKWTSNAGGSFSITREPSSSLSRGTEIILNMKDDMKEYLEESKLRSLIKTHSEFIDFPIELYVEKKEDKEITDDEEEDTNDENDEVKVEDVDEEENKKKPKKTKTVTEITNEWVTLNELKPLWCKNPSEVTNEEYNSFYKSLSNDYDEPMGQKHFSVEGNLEFKGILYIPKRQPFHQLSDNSNKKNIKLYVRKVFITDKSDELLPNYLSFIKGVVDSEDLPLNISREMLQQNKIMRVIRKNLIKKSIELFNELSEDSEKYDLFYKQFSQNIKLGIHEDDVNRNKLVKLLRYETAKSNGKTVSFDTYISNMKENQPGIYYATGESIEKIKSTPFLEGVLKRGYDVLLLPENIDEYSIQQIKDYGGKKLICITQENINLGEDTDEKEKFEEKKKKLEPLCKAMKEILGEKIREVVVSNRLDDSPSCIVNGLFGYTANMERIMRGQALGTTTSGTMLDSMKIMEINYDNQIINAMKEKITLNTKDKSVHDLTWLLYETSILSSGFSLSNPTAFSNRINKLIELGLNINTEDDEDDLNDLPDIDETKESNEAPGENDNNGDDQEDMEEVD